MLSNLVMNIAKSIVIKVKFGILPFNKSTLPLFLLTGVCWLAIFIPMPGWHPFFGIAIRSVLVSGIYFLVVLGFRLSPEMVTIQKIKWIAADVVEKVKKMGR